jgi:hypothetical protein
LCALAGCALGGCSGSGAGVGLGNGPGSFIVDPGKFDAYHCSDLVTRWKADNAREKELRNLMDRARQAPGGSVIGEITYRPDLESVVTEKKILQQQAAERKCELDTTYQSDQGVR